MALVKTLDIIAAAVAAFRHNNNSIIRTKDIKIPLDTHSNLGIVQSIIMPDRENLVEVREDDVEHAQRIIDDLLQRNTMALLTNKSLPEFGQNIHAYVTMESVPMRSMGILLWAPAFYESMQRADQNLHELSTLAFGSKFIGSVGDKIELTFHIVIERYNKEYGCWRYNGHDGNGNLISFLRKDKLSASGVKIKAKVKGHDNSKFTRGKTTNLNYVKELKDA